jgi:UDP-glucose 4-epimerase
MRALVTGGAGFIGSHIVEELLKKKAEVRVLDDLSTGDKSNVPEEVEFIKGSITDIPLLEKTMKDIDYVFHEAAITSVAFSITHPKTTWDVNIRGTKLLLNAAVKAGIKRFVFASSAAVYGNALPPLKEKMNVKPISNYGNSKRMSEMLMQEYYEKEGIDTISLRYFNVFGPRQSPESEYSGVISKFIGAMTRNTRPVIYGNGMQTRDFIYVKDVVRANMLALKPKKTKGQVYNIATGKAISLNGLVKSLDFILKSELDPIYESERLGDIKYSFADISRAKEKLDFVAKTSLEDGLKKTIDWYNKLSDLNEQSSSLTLRKTQGD